MTVVAGVLLVVGPVSACTGEQESPPTDDSSASETPSDKYGYVENICAELDWSVVDGLEDLKGEAEYKDLGGKPGNSACQQEFGTGGDGSGAGGFVSIEMKLARSEADAVGFMDSFFPVPALGKDIDDLPQWGMARFGVKEDEYASGNWLDVGTLAVQDDILVMRIDISYSGDADSANKDWPDLALEVTSTIADEVQNVSAIE